VAIIALYFFFLAGGLWHVVGVFQTVLRLLAAPVIVATAVLLCYEHFISLRRAEALHRKNSLAPSPRLAQRFLLWCFLVFAGGFAVELAGIHTGLLFGHYEYGNTLQPLFLGVPIAIGCAWLTMIVSSAAVAQRIFVECRWNSNMLFCCAAAALMVAFDFFMEPAAMKLHYWNWRDASVPLQNYVAWLAFGFLLAATGTRMHFFERRISPLAAHAYVAQLGYFILVMLS
jgi:putative membrane protein